MDRLLKKVLNRDGGSLSVYNILSTCREKQKLPFLAPFIILWPETSKEELSFTITLTEFYSEYS